MSSHHIVRDKQEPAILISDSTALAVEFIDSLLEWSPTLMVTEPVLDEVLKWGIKIDIVIANYSSIERLKPKLLDQSPVKLLGFETDDFIENGYRFLMEEGYDAVNLLADIYNSQALDLAKLFHSKLDSVIYYNNQKWIYVANGYFEKWVSNGQRMGIHPVATNTFFTSDGFYGNWDNEMILEPIELTSERSGTVTLKTNSKPLWVVEDLLESY